MTLPYYHTFAFTHLVVCGSVLDATSHSVRCAPNPPNQNINNQRATMQGGPGKRKASQYASSLSSWQRVVCFCAGAVWFRYCACVFTPPPTTPIHHRLLMHYIHTRLTHTILLIQFACEFSPSPSHQLECQPFHVWYGVVCRMCLLEGARGAWLCPRAGSCTTKSRLAPAALFRKHQQE